MGNKETHALKRLWLYSIICQNKAPASAKEGNTPKNQKTTTTTKVTAKPPQKYRKKERKKANCKTRVQNWLQS